MMVAFCAALLVMLDGMMEVTVPFVLRACLPVTHSLHVFTISSTG
jgi:hypothetical protein